LKILNGTNSVAEVLDKLENLIDKQIKNLPESSLCGKAKDEFYEIILSKTFVFYVPANSIKMNMVDASIDEVKEIIYTDMSEIIALTNLPLYKKIRYKINWIAIEFNKKNIEDKEITDKKISRYLPFLSIACELDILKKDSKNKKLNFRIDFEKLNKLYEKIGKASYFFRNAKKHFYQSLFSFQTSEQKNNDINYVRQVLIQKKYKDISISQDDLKSVFLYKCQICGNQHEVILSNSKRGRKRNIHKKYTRVSDDFIYEKTDKYYIVCKHSGTKHEGVKKLFSVKKMTITNNDSNENIDLDKVFLFQFFNFVLNDESQKIEYYINDEKHGIDVNAFIDKVK